MDCKEFQEQISAFVDNQVDEKIKLEAESHINICPSCYFDYKIETLVKNIISTKFKKATCSEQLKSKIIERLASQKSLKDKLIDAIESLYTSKGLRVAFALGLIIIFYLLIFNPLKSTEEKYYKELGVAIYDNCKNLRNHKYPEKAIFTSNHEQIMQFVFSNGIKNPIMPKTNWAVVFAGIEEENESILAHFLFNCEADTIYMMECEVDALRYTRYYNSFQKIHNDLRKKSFVKVDHGNCLIIFRLEENLLMTYAIPSHNHRAFEELIASLE